MDPSDYKVTLTDAHKKNPNVTVALRIRPQSNAELSRANFRTIVKALDEHVVVFDPPEDERKTDTHGRPILTRHRGAPSNFSKARDCKYAFDCVFGPDSNQDEVFEATAAPLIESVLNGFNATVFAYGATGAGKTHTMIGNDELGPGVMVLTMQELFARVSERRADQRYVLSMSYLEVYNETIRDLLVEHSPSLMLCDSGKGGVTIKGLSSREPQSADEVMELLRFGNGNRQQAPTNANATSSRSHAVLQITVSQSERTAATQKSIGVGKLSLIDLAGSERAAATENRGARLKEGANINQSLLALGNCINALGTNKKGHIPFRNSKLTRLLQDSLGGNCRTVMIANISPSSMCSEDTLNTLKYANRAKNIKTTVERNVVNVNHHVSRYVQIIRELTVEVDELKERLAAVSDDDDNRHSGRTSAHIVIKGAPTPSARERAMEIELSSLRAQTDRMAANMRLWQQCTKDQYSLLCQTGVATDTIHKQFESVCGLDNGPGEGSVRRGNTYSVRRFGAGARDGKRSTSSNGPTTPPASPSAAKESPARLMLMTPVSMRTMSSVDDVQVVKDAVQRVVPTDKEETVGFKAFAVAATSARHRKRGGKATPARNASVTFANSPVRRSPSRNRHEGSPRTVTVDGMSIKVTTSPIKRGNENEQSKRHSPLHSPRNSHSTPPVDKLQKRPAKSILKTASQAERRRSAEKNNVGDAHPRVNNVQPVDLMRRKRIGGMPSNLSRPTAASAAKVVVADKENSTNVSRIPKPSTKTDSRGLPAQPIRRFRA